MKKLMVFLIVICTLFLFSCGSGGYISKDLTAEVMKQQYPSLYPMTDDECGHPYLYFDSISGMNIDLSPEKYHCEYCIYPNCEHKKSIVSHADLWRIASSSMSVIYEDGKAYHPTIFECTECGQKVFRLMLCKKGVARCDEYGKRSNLDVYSMEEWEQIALGNKKMMHEEENG